ncbi:MAG: helix-turn-helix transcriptional regulator [Desulfitobacteriaceae bacterium]|nr:helix-turn-helix transcriptional regulator [Desulfitobacteriaceae bacterium]
MSQRSVKGSLELAKSIKLRRNELNLTIEEAASKAGVGTKTWSRYEAGGSIRKDKCRGLCKALNWHSLPGDGEVGTSNKLNIKEYRNHEAWSPYLAETFGDLAAISFVIGSDILLDNLQDDMNELSSMPRGSHVGQISVSWIETLLPPQFLMRYDYDFLYILRTTVIQFRLQAPKGSPIIAHSVIEELALYLILEESRFLMESIELDGGLDDYESWDEWIFGIFDDMDLITFLYSDTYLIDGHTYHFDCWLEKQFYCK